MQTLPPRLTVVLVSWNTRDTLGDCLAALCNALCGVRIPTEIWVVDNASSDGSAEMVRDQFEQVHLIANTENHGFARACNQAIRASDSDFVLLLNPDTILPPETIPALLVEMALFRRAAVCAPLLTGAGCEIQLSWARFPDLWSAVSGRLDRGQSPYPLADFADPVYRAGMRSFPVDWAGGACLLVRRAAIVSVGLLDEAFFLYSEEVEWCHRFQRHGWETRLIPTVTATHRGGASSAQMPRRARRYLADSQIRLYRLLYGSSAMLSVLVIWARWLLSPLRPWTRRAVR